MKTDSIARLSLAAAGSYEDFSQKAAAYLSAARSAAADGITWSEFGELAFGLMRVLIDTIDHIRDMTGEQKKAFVLDAVGSLFDLVADKAVPPMLWPLYLIVRPAVRSLVLALASGAVEQILPLVRAS